MIRSAIKLAFISFFFGSGIWIGWTAKDFHTQVTTDPFGTVARLIAGGK